MENIRQAVERARAEQHSSKPQGFDKAGTPRQQIDSGAARNGGIEETELNPRYLETKRIVSHNGADTRSRPYDMLRTQVVQSMATNKWRVLGVTSPSPGCGKTLTAINLALSIARQPDQPVVLVDLDLQRPQIANSLGLTGANKGVLDILEEQATLQSSIICARAGKQRLNVLPTTPTRVSSELIGARAMRNLLQELRTSYKSHIVILDLPPILSSDDVIALLPQIDCILLVAAVGLSKASEVEECKRHLQSSNLVRVVVNKATEANTNYYYY